MDDLAPPICPGNPCRSCSYAGVKKLNHPDRIVLGIAPVVPSVDAHGTIA